MMMLSFVRLSSLRIPVHNKSRHLCASLGRIDFATTTKSNNSNHKYGVGRSLFSSSSSSSIHKPPNRNSQQVKKDYEYCVDLVQNRDRESYLCGLLLPVSARRSYFAVRAFNVELASVKDGSVSRKVGGAQFEESGATMALKLRLQWWHEALNTIYKSQEHGQQPNSTMSSATSDDALLDSMIRSTWNNPVVRELETAVRQSQLTRRFLERLVEAREIDLDVRQLDTMDDQLRYAESTFSSLLYLSLECTNVREEESDLVAYHAGMGQGVTMALRAATIRWTRGESSIPRDLLPPDQFPHHKFVDPDAEISESEKERLRNAIQQMAEIASSHLAVARENQGKVPKSARSCFLPIIPALHYLSKLEEVQYDPFHERLLEPNNLRLLFLLSRTWLTGVF